MSLKMCSGVQRIDLEVALQACGMLSGRHMGTEEILNSHLAVTVKTVPCTSTYMRSAHNELVVNISSQYASQQTEALHSSHANST